MSYFYADLLFVLPAPSKILLTLWQRSDRFLLHTIVTFKEMMAGFLLALSMAFPLALLMLAWKSLRIILQPLFIVIQSIPMFSLAPIMVIWFGWSFIAIVIPTALMIFFPLTMNIYQGLRATPQHLLDYFQVNQATFRQTFFKLQLPYALPHICAGFRISAAIAGIGTIAGEWAGAQEGLGMLMIESRRGADLEMTFGALFCLIGLSLLLYSVIIFLESKIMGRKKLKLHPKNIGLIVLLLGTLACFAYSKQINDNSLPTSRLVLDWLPNPNHVPLYVGIEKGFFKKQGIHLEIQKLRDPGDGIPYLIAQQTDLAISYTSYALRAAGQGAPIKVIGTLIKEPLNALLFRDDEDIHLPADLNGKSIGYCMDGSQTRCLTTLLKQSHIFPNHMLNVSFDFVTSLGTKQVDAVYGAFWNIESEHLRSLNIKTKYFKVTELGMPNYYELLFLARKETLFSQPEFISRFQIAIQESIDFSKKNPDEAFEIYVKFNPDKGNKTQAWEKQAWILTRPVLADDQKQNPTVWKNFYEWLQDHQLLKNSVEIRELIEPVIAS